MVGVTSHKVCRSAIRLLDQNPKMSSIFRTMSRRSSDSQDTVVNSEEISYPKIQNDLDDWKLPKVSTQEIYKKGTFKFLTDYTIRTSGMSVSL